MRRWFAALPGPTVVKVVAAVVVVLAAVVALVFVYDWIGTNLLDSGGSIG